MATLRDVIIGKMGLEKAKMWSYLLSLKINAAKPIDETTLPEIAWDDATEWLHLDKTRCVNNGGPLTLYYGQKIHDRQLAIQLRDNGVRVVPSASAGGRSEVITPKQPKRPARRTVESVQR